MVFPPPSLVLIALLAWSSGRGVPAAPAPVWEPLAESKLMAAPSTRDAMGPVPVSLTLPLYNFRNVLYYFEVHVGTPSQTVRLGLDTTMANIGITTIKGDTHKYYNHSRSSTYKPDGRAAAFRDGMTGVLVQDRLALAGDVAAMPQRFVEITNVTAYGPVYSIVPNDGWFGLGKNQTDSVGGFPTFLRALAQSDVIDAPCVTLSTPRGKNGQITFGSGNALRRGHTVVPTDPHPGLWGFNVLDIKVGNTSIPMPKVATDAATLAASHGFAALDNLTPYIVGSVDAVTEIAKVVNATLTDYGLFSVPCDVKLPDTSFVSRQPPDGGLTLTQTDLVGQRISETHCEFLIAAHRDKKTHEVADWALGAPVFHRYSFEFCWFDTPGGAMAPVLSKALCA